VAAAIWASLIVLHWLFLLVMFSACHLACSTPARARRALPGIAAVSAVMVISDSFRERSVDPLQLTLGLGLFAAMMQAIHEQSEERRRLTSKLETTRGQLVESERRVRYPTSASGSSARSTTRWAGFASIVMLYEAARAELPSRPEAGLGRLEEIGPTARSSLAEARRMVWALRPEALVEGTLADAVDGLVRDFRSETGLDATSRISREARSVELRPRRRCSASVRSSSTFASTREPAGWHSRQNAAGLRRTTYATGTALSASTRLYEVST
jgi:hypothetical protein